MQFPKVRHRRLRQSSALRELVREHTLKPEDLIYPLFIVEGTGIKKEISSMPGVFHYSLDTLQSEIEEIVSLGIRSIIVFGVPDQKDALGREAYAENGIVQRAIKHIKSLTSELVVIADTCLCQFTDHGHCGVIDDTCEPAVIGNDASLQLLAETAVSQAKAGADVIAPSNMMDGFVMAIRTALDEAGFNHIPIMSYAVKYASSFYGPFREAAHSAPQFGDRKTYQMDPANAREALREAKADVTQGADMLIVKPAMAFMDIIRMLRDHYDLPIVAYNVSGEYAMIKAAGQKGWINERDVVLELLTGFKRAGADIILTYFAKDAVRYLKDTGQI